MMIKEMASLERPREKALRFGLETLSNQELIAVILRSGTKDQSVISLAQQILNKSNGLNKLPLLTMSELMSIKGIKKAKALSLMSAVELAKRMQFSQEVDNLSRVTTAKEVYEYLLPKLKFEVQEKFYVLFLNQQQDIIKEKVLFTGSMNEALISPREIFKEALGCNSMNIICVHNHPGNMLYPSKKDILVTKQLANLGKTMGIYLLDHIIIGSNGYFSLKSKNLF